MRFGIFVNIFYILFGIGCVRTISWMYICTYKIPEDVDDRIYILHFIRIPITYSVVEKCVTHIGSFAKRERILRTNIKAYTPEAISYLPPFHRERGLQNLEICHFINNWVTESCNLCWASVRCLNILLLCIIYYYLWSLVLVYEPGHIISSS